MTGYTTSEDFFIPTREKEIYKRKVLTEKHIPPTEIRKSGILVWRDKYGDIIKEEYSDGTPVEKYISGCTGVGFIELDCSSVEVSFWENEVPREYKEERNERKERRNFVKASTKIVHTKFKHQKNNFTTRSYFNRNVAKNNCRKKY